MPWASRSPRTTTASAWPRTRVSSSNPLSSSGSGARDGKGMTLPVTAVSPPRSGAPRRRAEQVAPGGQPAERRGRPDGANDRLRDTVGGYQAERVGGRALRARERAGGEAEERVPVHAEMGRRQRGGESE